MEKYFLTFSLCLMSLCGFAQQSFDYIGLGLLKTEAGFDPDLAAFDWGAMDGDKKGVSTYIFINPDRMIHVQTYAISSTAFLMYDFNIKANQLSIYINSPKLKVRTAIQEKRSAFEVIPDQFKSELNDSLRQELSQKLADKNKQQYVIDSLDVELLPGYYCDKYKLNSKSDAPKQEAYMWILKDAPKLSDFVEENLPGLLGVTLKSYFKNKYFAKTYGVIEFEQDVLLPDTYKLDKDEYELKSWKEFNNYLK